MTEEQKLKNEIEYLKSKLALFEKYKEREKYKVYKRQTKLYKRNKNSKSIHLNIPVDIIRKYKLNKGDYLGFKQDSMYIYIHFDNLENTIKRKLTSKGNNKLSINIPSDIRKKRALNNNTVLNMFEFNNKLFFEKIKKS